MDQQLDRRIAECDAMIESCKTAIGITEPGEEKKRLNGRLKDLDGVRAGLVKQKLAAE